MNTVQYHAKYSDGYSYKVIYDPAERKTYLATEGGGRMPVPFYQDGAEFVEFYFTGPSGISVQYAWKLRAQMDQLLTIPVKPAEPPPVQSVDSRIHVERGSNWAAHKQAHAEQRLAEERKHREAARAEINNQTPDPAKVAAAREINTQIAQTMRPRGKGQYLVNE